MDSESENASEQGEMVAGGVNARNRKPPEAAARLAAARGECYTPRCDGARRRRRAGGRAGAPFLLEGDRVPTYDYRCDRCERTFEVRQRISEEPLTNCDRCGGPIRRLLSAAPFILKGGGWYVTDYPSEGRKKGMEAEKKSSGDPTPSAAPATTGTDAAASTGSASKSGETSSDAPAPKAKPKSKPTPTPSS